MRLSTALIWNWLSASGAAIAIADNYSLPTPRDKSAFFYTFEFRHKMFFVNLFAYSQKVWFFN